MRTQKNACLLIDVADIKRLTNLKDKAAYSFMKKVRLKKWVGSQ